MAVLSDSLDKDESSLAARGGSEGGREPRVRPVRDPERPFAEVLTCTRRASQIGAM
jgi:hypothetical protein